MGAKKFYCVRLSNGELATRQSARPYTHAVIVVWTANQKNALLEANRREQEQTRREMLPLGPAAGNDDDRRAYEAAQQRLTFLEQPVTEECTRTDGSKYVATHPRWLSEGFRRGHGPGYGRQMLEAAEAAVKATARGKFDDLKLQLEHLVDRHDWIKRNFVVGLPAVYRWSMSERAALRAVDEARRYHPLNEVFATSEIEVLDRKPPKPKAAKEKT